MSMTIKEAIRQIRNYIGFLYGTKEPQEDICEAMNMAIDALREKEERRWIPVTERLPESNMPVLVYCTNTTIQGGYTIHIGSCDMKQFWFLRTQPGLASFPVREWQVTHWMPMPDRPKEDAE